MRANSTPVSSKAILQKLPLRVYKRLEDVIAKCSYMEWKHFDAGVVKVCGAARRGRCVYVPAARSASPRVLLWG